MISIPSMILASKNNNKQIVRNRLIIACSASIALSLLPGFIQKSEAQQSIFDTITNSKSVSKNDSSSAASTGSSPISNGTSSTTGNTSYPSAAPALNQADNWNKNLYPASGLSPVQSEPAPASSGQIESPNALSGVPSITGSRGQAASGLQNAINRGIQTNLTRGISRGTNALDSLGRRVGLPGLGTMLNPTNSYTNTPAPISSGGAYAASGGMAQSEAEEPGYRRHVPSSGYQSPASSIRPLDAGKAAYDAAGRRARESQEAAYLRSAQQAEARGDWNQAAFAYRNAVGYEITPEDDEAGKAKHIGSNDAMLERHANDPRYRQMNMKAAYCDVQLLNQDYAGVKTNVDKRHTEHGLSNLYDALMYSDKGNAAWYYLKAVWWCSEYKAPEWNYVMAFNLINDALKAPRISPSIREKCIALQNHIKPARDLQREDRNRSQYCIEQETVYAKEHPQVVTEDVSETRETIDDRHERVTTYRRPVMNTELWQVERYGEYKRDLSEKYPAWKSSWLKLLNEKMSSQNPGIAVPQGPSNEEPAMYCPRRWEELAFGPLDFKIGRDYPLTRHVAGMGHYDHDLLPKAYMAMWNSKFLGK